MALNAQHKRISKNRVSITYDVETNGAMETKELPFVMGVVGDFSAHKDDRVEVADREFFQIDKDNFNQVLSRIGPKLSLKVDNVLADDNSQIEANMTFNSMKDFTPEAIVDKVDALKKLSDTRNKLKILLSKADRSRDLEKILKDVLQDADTINTLCQELGIEEKGETE